MSKYKYYNKDWNWSSGPPLCAFFLRRGRCKYEGECKFSHDKATGDENKVPLCKFWLEGECKFGDGCTFRHATEDVDALTARYNAQLMNQASLGMEYVWHPDFGMTLATGAGVVPAGVVPQYPTPPSPYAPYQLQQYTTPATQSGLVPITSYPTTSPSSPPSYPPPSGHQYPLAQVSGTPVLGALTPVPSAPDIPSRLSASLIDPSLPTTQNALVLDGKRSGMVSMKREREGRSELNNPSKRTKLLTLTSS